VKAFQGSWLAVDDPHRGALSPGEDVLGGVGVPVREGAAGAYRRCGVAMRRGALRSGESAGSGSVSKTSMAGPTIQPSCRARSSALVSTRRFRAVFTRYAESHHAELGLPAVPAVQAASARWGVMKSAPENSSCLVTSRAPAAAAWSSLRWSLQAMTSMPNARPTGGMAEPTRPSPTAPSVAPLRSEPTVCC
jgi:hypothetical protein